MGGGDRIKRGHAWTWRGGRLPAHTLNKCITNGQIAERLKLNSNSTLSAMLVGNLTTKYVGPSLPAQWLYPIYHCHVHVWGKERVRPSEGGRYFQRRSLPECFCDCQLVNRLRFEQSPRYKRARDNIAAAEGRVAACACDCCEGCASPSGYSRIYTKIKGDLD